MGSEDEPLLWANRARENCHQHYRQLPQHQRAAHSLPRSGGVLVSLCTVVKREVATQPQFSTQFSPPLSVGILPSYLGKALGLPSLLPCGYFHNRISVLSVPLHHTFLYDKRQDIPISGQQAVRLISEPPNLGS